MCPQPDGIHFPGALEKTDKSSFLNELLKAFGFPIGGEVINVLALYVINPGGVLRGLETKGPPSPQFGCFFFFTGRLWCRTHYIDNYI